MTLRWLKVFLAVAKHLNVTLASHDLHVTQPAISHQLKSLQDAIGAQLITKTRTGIVLTKTGVAFRRDAEAILSQLSEMGTKYATVSVSKREREERE